MKLVIIGAGSAFGGRLSVDALSRKPLQNCEIALCDIDSKKLKTVHAYVQKVIDSNNLPATVTSSTDRRDLLPNADFVVISVAIGGPAYYDKPYEFEISIPLQYGIEQNVGDTVGPGGVFRALRTGPALMEMVEDIKELCPKTTILNYTNPMAMLTWILNHKIDTNIAGLCHGVQGTSKKIAGYIGAPHKEIGYWVAGINHLAWFLEFTHKGKDAYPRLLAAAQDPEIYKQNTVRFELMQEFGYFPTESSHHDAEYVPWYQHDADAWRPRKGRSSAVREKRQHWYEDMGVKATQANSIELVRSHEYASGIMEAMVTGEPMRFNGNVMNNGLISNLPQGSCVEVPCFTDGQGIHPCVVGDLPPQCAALCRSNIAVQELAVRAVIERDKQAAFQSLLLDPSVGAKLSIKRAREMFDEMWKAEGSLLDYYKPRHRQKLKRTCLA